MIFCFRILIYFCLIVIINLGAAAQSKLFSWIHWMFSSHFDFCCVDQGTKIDKLNFPDTTIF